MFAESQFLLPSGKELVTPKICIGLDTYQIIGIE